MGKTTLHRKNTVKDWRKHRGLTQEALAELMGTTKGSINKYENRKLPITGEILEQLTFHLRCTEEDLFRHKPSDDPQFYELRDKMDQNDRETWLNIGQTLIARKETSKKK